MVAYQISHAAFHRASSVSVVTGPQLPQALSDFDHGPRYDAMAGYARGGLRMALGDLGRRVKDSVKGGRGVALAMW